jgi:TolB-like protein/Flp pilus assembly protein TadD
LAEPGGICISAKVHDEVRGKIETSFADAGERQLKNMTGSVRVFRAARPELAPDRPALALPDKPSIAVLPFQNMSGDPNQEYFADGMVEEIITALSRMKWLFVIARNSSFTYKGRAVDVKQIGRELGVRYVLEGSVRKAADKVRIAGQLIDASNGAHLWAERFDGRLEDIFELQDQVTANVVGSIAPKLEQAEIERTKHKPTHSLDAYDYYLRGMADVHRWTREANMEALAHFNRAVELDPSFSSAYGMAARCYSQRKASLWTLGSAEEITEAEKLSRRAVATGSGDAVALSAAGIALSYVVGDLDEGDALIDQALALNPNLAWAWLFSGWVKVWRGEPEDALERLTRAMRLSPQDFQLFNMQTATAGAHFIAGRHDEAFTWAMAALRGRPDYAFPHLLVATSGALGGRLAEAQKAMTRLRQLLPELSISSIRGWFPVRRPEHIEMWEEGLRKAGLSE